MKAAIYNTLGSGGGAHLAAARLQYGLTDVKFPIDHVTLDLTKPHEKGVFFLNVALDRVLKKIFFRKNDIYHSSNLFALRQNLSKYDTINLHWFSNGLVSFRQLLEFKGNLVLTCHDSWLACGFEHHAKMGVFSNRLMDRYLFEKKAAVVRKAKAVVLPSEWQMAVYQERFPDVSHFSVIPNICGQEFVDSSKIPKKSSSNNNLRTIGVVANKLFQNPAKGAKNYREFFAILDAAQTRCRVQVAGRHSEADREISKTYKYLEFGFLGELDEEQMFRFYNEIDLLVHLSNFENLSNVLVESRFHSLPAIALDVGGNSEILTTCHDFLIPPGLIAQCRDILNDLVVRNNGDPTEIRAVYEAKFSNKMILKKYMDILNGNAP